MGRAGWFDEVMRFYGRYLKGETPTVADPPFAVQTNDGKWRSEKQWPPADARDVHDAAEGRQLRRPRPVRRDRVGRLRRASPRTTAPIRPIRRSSPASGRSRSRCPYDVHLSGEPTASIDVTTALPNANLVIDVYDLSQDENGDWTGPLVTRQGHLVRNPGRLDDPADALGRRLEAQGRRPHRGARDRQQPGLVADGRAERPARDRPRRLDHAAVPRSYLRTQTIQGDPGVQLAPYLETHIATAPADAVELERSDFTLPPALKKAPKNSAYSGGYTEPVGGPAPRH